MHKKLVAALTIAIFVLSSVAIFTPASAHFTLGDYRAGYRYHANDFDPHLSGPLAYVWPGSGLASFTGAPAGFPMGYQSPYPGGNPPGQFQSVYQLEGTAYAPFGAILTSTADHSNRGPLIFAFNYSNPAVTIPAGLHLNFTGVTIYIPPEFDLASALSNPGMIESTFGATANDFALSQSDMNDPFGPGWWVLTYEGTIRFWPEHNYAEWYYLRINDVVAPIIAGKYNFKMFLWDMNTNSGAFQMNIPGAWTVDSAMAGTTFIPSSSPTFLTFPVENWPILLVKGEIDPGIVTGTIRYGTFNQTLYGHPINFPGMIDMVGTAIDPYLPDHPSTGRPVEARGYFNASAAGHYEVEGVAPGVYTIYAQAAGYPRQTIADNVVILPGQSFHLDGYLQPGAVVHGQIFSKHLFGEEPWPSNPRPVSIAIYSANDYAEEHIVAFSPWNKTHAPYMAYDWGLGYSSPEPLPVAYPWDTATAGVIPTTIVPYSYYSQFFPAPVAAPGVYRAHPPVNCGLNLVGVPGFDACGKPDGVGPAQYWWVDALGRFTNGGGSNSFIFKFGVKGVYGAPTDIDGHIPQVYATWVNGLTAGRYYLRAYLNGYVQTLQDGVTLDEYYFDVSQNEWAGDIFQPMDLRVSSFINKTVHFHDLPGTLTECPIRGCEGNQAQGDSRGSRYLIAEVRDSNNVLVGLNFTMVNGTSARINNTFVVINGFGMMGPDPGTGQYFPGQAYAPACPPEEPLGGLFFSNFCAGMKFSYYRYAHYRDYGLPSGTYTVHIYMRGYVQQTFESVSLTLSGSPAIISDHVYRGARFNITVYSIDWEHPRVQRPWEFPSARLRVYVYNDKGWSYSHVGTRYQPAGPNAAGVYAITGRCNNVAFEIADHCHIIEWDGRKLLNTNAGGAFLPGLAGAPVDTPPDYYASDAIFAGFLPWDQVFFYDGFLTYASEYRFTQAARNFAADNAFETGTYSFYGYSYGYLQHKDYSVYVMKGGFGDMKLNLLQGVNITMNIPFKKEGIYSPTETNMTMRVRIFDDSGRLIGTASTKAPDTIVYGNGDPYGIARFIPGGTSVNWDGFAWTYYIDPFVTIGQVPAPHNAATTADASPNLADTFMWYGNYYGTGDGWQVFDSDVNKDGTPDFSSYISQSSEYLSWIPAGTKQVRVFIAGTYDGYGDPLNALYAGVLPGRTYGGLNQWQQYGIPGFSSTIPEGIPVSYSGKYYAEVDTWNEYPNATFGNPGSAGAPGAHQADARNWYPPVEGLLEGDSFHTIPGATPDVFGYTGSTLAVNGLGPYAQRMVWEIPNGHLGSEVSVVYELDKRGYISGNIYGFTWSDELRPQSWVNVVASAATGNVTFNAYSWDAHYDMYLDAGQYELAVIAWSPAGQGYTVVKTPVTISSGQSSTGVTFQLERSNIPVPEFSGIAVVAFSALAASVYLLRRKRR